MMKTKRMCAWLLLSACFSCHGDLSGQNLPARAASAAGERAGSIVAPPLPVPRFPPRFSFNGSLRGYKILNALFHSYSDRIDRFDAASMRLRVGEKLFFWTEGRLLPVTAYLDPRRLSRYAPYSFYRYSENPVPAPLLPNSRAAEFIKRYENRSSSGNAGGGSGDAATAPRPGRHPGFYAALYGAESREQMEESIIRVDFLGKRFSVNAMLETSLRRIEEKIVALAESDTEIEEFLSRINDIGGYNWRNIAGTQSLSLHSYGIAVDLVESGWESKNVYWSAARVNNREWYNIPHEERWQVPPGIVEFFEEEGFYWGGKWLFFDNMHFEYRPEIFYGRRERE